MRFRSIARLRLRGLNRAAARPVNSARPAEPDALARALRQLEKQYPTPPLRGLTDDPYERAGWRAESLDSWNPRED